MILGVILILIALVSLYLIFKTDLENDAVQDSGGYGSESENRIYLFLGTLILLVLGVVSIIKHFS